MKLFFSFLFFLYCSFVLSQSNSFDGSILYHDRLSRDCSMDLFIDSQYKVSGSIHRMVENKQQTIPILGEFNFEDNSIYFKEDKSISVSCPIFFHGKIKNLIDNIYVIAGIFQSSTPRFCDSGHINLINRNFKFNLYNKKVSNLENNDSLAEEAMKKILKNKLDEEKVYKTVLADNKIHLKTNKDSIFIKIYDNLRVDGDKVKILWNNKVVSDNLVISGKVSEYLLIAKKGENKLEIIAQSEGSIPMNTSKVELYNNRLHEFYENKLYKRQSAIYIIHYE